MQQLYAARELSKKKWIYHKKFMTWFKAIEVADAPSSVKESGLYGTFKYFDYSSSWTFRKKDKFNFEFQFMEETDR